ncbi:MAG: tRNA pseudouridine(13) synthase TruD [Geobacter sp.]|nr:tRNA pseudouridine(13) synthase TruD [Geobacter sp.]
MKYLTTDIPGTGGVMKESPEDFRVEEIPLYLPCGEGEHVYLTFEKRGITTLEAIRRIARGAGVQERDIGYAGMKDARALTVQTISVPRVAPELLMGLDLPSIRSLAAVPHRNKLKLGHLAGNRFRIRVRGVTPEALQRAEAVLNVLSERGVPNFFGEQRYGAQGNSHLIGRALLRQDWHGAVDVLMGDPAAVEDAGWRTAIEAYRNGDLAGSIAAFPRFCATEREVLKRLVARPDDYRQAFRAVHPRLVKLYLSAFQSFLFDRVLALRLDGFDRVMAGDLAWKHANGACFLVEDVVAEEPRAKAFEISPTGPMFGCRMKLPDGEPHRLEESILLEEGITLEQFDLAGGLRMEGERRPLRVPLGEPLAGQDTEGLLLEFSLPKGSYATAVLREVMKRESMDSGA